MTLRAGLGHVRVVAEVHRAAAFLQRNLPPLAAKAIEAQDRLLVLVESEHRIGEERRGAGLIGDREPPEGIHAVAADATVLGFDDFADRPIRRRRQFASDRAVGRQGGEQLCAGLAVAAWNVGVLAGKVFVAGSGHVASARLGIEFGQLRQGGAGDRRIGRLLRKQHLLGFEESTRLGQSPDVLSLRLGRNGLIAKVIEQSSQFVDALASMAVRRRDASVRSISAAASGPADLRRAANRAWTTRSRRTRYERSTVSTRRLPVSRSTILR